MRACVDKLAGEAIRGELRGVRWAVCGLVLVACASSDVEPAAVEAVPPTATAPAPEPTVEPPPTPRFLPGGELDPMSLTGAFSQSMQNPTDGWLVGGVALPKSGKGYQFNPHKDQRRRYGTVELVQALIRAAGTVEEAHPGGTLTINDIAMPAGGEIGGHASHRNGRDVDVLFYLVDEGGKPYPSKSIPIEPDGTGDDYHDLSHPEDDVSVTLDVARTWAFVEALMSDESAHINRIFVVEHVRAMLLAHAEKIGAPELARRKFGHVTCQPKFPHDDHFHIRFFCAPDDIEAGCEDTFPIYPWHQAHLADAGVDVKLAKWRKRPKPKLTSHAEAAAR